MTTYFTSSTHRSESTYEAISLCVFLRLAARSESICYNMEDRPSSVERVVMCAA